MVSMHSVGGSIWGARAKSFFRGDGLHHISKSLLQGGQAYYLSVILFILRNAGSDPYPSATIGLAVISVALLLSPTVPGEWYNLLGPSYFALASVMAYRVFHNIILGILTYPSGTTAGLTSIIFALSNSRHDGDGDDNTNTLRRHKLRLPSHLNSNFSVQLNTRTKPSEWERSSTGDYIPHDGSEAYAV
jgi:hypothetical protein